MKSYKGLLLKHLSLDTSHRQCKYNTHREEQWLAVPHNVVRGRGSFNIIKCTGFLRVHDNAFKRLKYCGVSFIKGIREFAM